MGVWRYAIWRGQETLRRVITNVRPRAIELLDRADELDADRVMLRNDAGDKQFTWTRDDQGVWDGPEPPEGWPRRPEP